MTSQNQHDTPSTIAGEANALPTQGADVEKQEGEEERLKAENVSAFKSLGWLDRFLALWILLAIVIGILLGNFVPSTGPALQRGKFVGVSIPIGKLHRDKVACRRLTCNSGGIAGHDVPDSLQSAVRNTTPRVPAKATLDPDRL